MSSSVRQIAAIAACVCVFASGAQAQEQTPENAQKFIGQIAELGQISFSWHNDDDGFDSSFWWDYSTSAAGTRRAYKKETAPIWNVHSEGRCGTGFKFKDTYESDRKIETGEAAWRIDWQAVAKVEVTGNLVYVTSLRTTSGGLYSRFTLPNEALAKRMGYAMEFLRVSCDATQGTGF